MNSREGEAFASGRGLAGRVLRALRVRSVIWLPFWCLLEAASKDGFYLHFISCTLVAEKFLTMLLTSSVESQAVLGLPFFSPSAATLCRGTPDPTLGFPGRPRPARAPAGPGPGPAGGRAGLLPIRGRLEVLGRPGRGPDRAWAGARSRLAPQGFRRPAGGAAAGPSNFGRPGSAHTVLTRSGHLVVVSSPVLLCLLARRLRARTRELGQGEERYLDAVARLSGSLVAPRGFGRSGLQPTFFAPSSALARAGPGPSASSPAGAAGRDE